MEPASHAPEPENGRRGNSLDAAPVRPELVFARERSFAPLRGISIDQLFGRTPLPPEQSVNDELLRELRAIVRITLQEMNRLNLASPLIPLDRPAQILELLTRESARAVLLYAAESRSDTQGRVIGFARVFTDPEDFPDRDRIPAEFFEGDVCRFDRFFIREEGRIFDSRGGAASRLLDELGKVAAGKIIIAKVLVGPESLHPAWLVAKRALEQRGFEDTGQVELEMFAREGESPIPGQFRWYLYPPQTESGRARFADVRARMRELERPVQVRLAHTVGNVPLVGGTLLCFSTEPDAWNLAKIYPGNSIVGVPSNREIVWKEERLANLRVGRQNLLEPVLAPESVSTVVVFGALPDVAAEGQPEERLSRFIACQVDHLQEGGRLIVRDTFHPSGLPRSTCLELRSVGADGQPEAERFDQFLTTLRQGNFLRREAEEAAQLPDSKDGAVRYLVSSQLANEFQLKAAYVADLAREIERPYTAYDLDRTEALIARHGLRLLFCAPEYNEWVYRHHRRGKISFMTPSGAPWPDLPTNFRLVAEKVGPDQPVAISRMGDPVRVFESQFLSTMVCERTVESAGRPLGQHRSLVHRPNVTLDLVPYFVTAEDVFVVGRLGYPRPIVLEAGKLLDGSRRGPFLTEQIAVIVDGADLGTELKTHRAAVAALGERVGIRPAQVRGFRESEWYLPSADITDEKVVMQPLEVEPMWEREVSAIGASEFSTDGARQSIAGGRLLQACQVGGLSDARLERAVYELYLGLERVPDPWIGAPLDLNDSEVAYPKVPTLVSLDASGGANFRFLPGAPDTFFEVYRGTYREQFAAERTGVTLQREFAVPGPQTGYSNNVVVVMPLVKVDGEVLVGVHRSPDMPAGSLHGVGPEFPTVPQFLVPRDRVTFDQAELFVRQQFEAIFGGKIRQFWPAGEPYFVSPGAVPRMVYPYGVELETLRGGETPLYFTPLAELLRHRSSIRCGQFRTLVYRTSHALGLFGNR